MQFTCQLINKFKIILFHDVAQKTTELGLFKIYIFCSIGNKDCQIAIFTDLVRPKPKCFVTIFFIGIQIS